MVFVLRFGIEKNKKYREMANTGATWWNWYIAATP